MPDKEQQPGPGPKPYTAKPYSGEGLFPTIGPTTAQPILPGGQKSTSYKRGYTPGTDPFHITNDTPESIIGGVEGGLDAVQPWYDKLGNGAVKFAGSFADGILSTVGTVYAIPASLITWDGTKFWDNPFTELGNDISTSVNENFKNYQSLSEQHASAWSPKYWASWNFVSDNILGNLGYAAAAYLTGAGVSKMLSKLAPYIAGRNLNAAMDVIKADGFDALKNMNKAYSAVKRWDAAQQGISVGIAAGGEASVEAYSAVQEYKKNMIGKAVEQFGSEGNIPKSVLDKINEDGDHIGNTVYMMNLPVLAGANLIQWGKALSGFNSEFKQYSKNALKLNATAEFAAYSAAGDEIKTGVLAGLRRGFTATGKALKSNITEAGQEGAQFIISEGTKNWYQRKNDPKGWKGTWDYLDPYLDAAGDLFTTKEGVSNLLGGFAGGVPFGIKDYVRQWAGDPSAKKLSDEQLSRLNNVFGDGTTVKQNLKIYLEGMARHASAEHDLQQSLSDGDEHMARNAKFDQLKTYINSRIQTGRMDLLQDEIDQLSQLDDNEFKTFFNLADDLNIDKKAVLDKFQNTAKDMHDTYKKMDRLFMPDMYKLNSLPEEQKTEKLQQLGEYKSMLWSYMMDFKDREHRAKTIDAELSQTFGGLVNVGNMMEDKFKSAELNDLYRQYVAASVESALSKQAAQGSTMPGPTSLYNESADVKKADAIKQRIKDKIMEVSKGDLSKQVSIEDFMGMDKKDFIEDYLFNIDKTLMPILNQPVVQTALGINNIHSIITKVHDLADLHAERFMAMHSYNQLASAVKTGSFMDRFMDNPNYKEDVPETIKDKNGKEVPNPEYQPKRITSDKMMQYDGYAQNKSIRKDFYNEQRQKAEENRQAQADFDAELDQAISDVKSDKNKDFHNRIKRFINGSPKTGKGYKAMNNLELARARDLLQRHITSLSQQGHFDTSTEKMRANFDKDAYLDLEARNKAITSEINRRKKDYGKKVEKAAKEVARYVTVNKIPVADLKAGFEIDGERINDAVVLKAKAIITEREQKKADAQATKDRATNEAIQQGKPADIAEENNIVSEDAWQRFKQTGKLEGDDYGTIIPNITNKIERGELLTDRETDIYNKYEAAIQKKLAARKSVNRTPVVEKKIGTVLQPEPFVDVTQDVSLPVKVISQVQTEAGKLINYTGEEGFIRLRRQDIKFDGKENVYDDNGNVQLNQLIDTAVLGDSRSPINLNRKPLVRFKYTGYNSGAKQEPSIAIELSSDNGKTWKSSGYYVQGKYKMDGSPIELPEFVKGDEAKNAERHAAYNATIERIQKEATEKGYVMAEVKGTPSFGRLIENKKDQEGLPERRGLRESFGHAPFNDPSNQFSVQFAVLYNQSDTEVHAVVPDENAPDGILTDVNNIPGMHIPAVLLSALGKVRTKSIERGGNKQLAGQTIALLPTGKMNAEGTAQVRFPILLSGSMLSDHTSKAYSIGSGVNRGSDVNMGEILVDALLNPHKAEHQQLFNGLFKMVGMTYEGIENSNWKEFYTNENMQTLINKVFFSSVTATQYGNYSLPFKFEVVDRGEDGSKAIRIGISDGLLSSANNKEVDIFMLGKDGKIFKPINEKAAQDFVQFRIEDERQYRKTNNLTENAEVNYDEIQSVIKNKAFRIPIGEIASSKQHAYSGFVLDESGKLTVKDFPSYFDYADELKLIQSTVQGISMEAGKQQFFVNQRVYFAPKWEETENLPAEPKAKKTRKAKAKIEEDVTLGRGVVTGVIPVAFERQASEEAQKNTAKKAGYGATLRGAMDAAKKKPGAQPMIEMHDTRQHFLNVNPDDTAHLYYGEVVTHEITSILLDRLLKEKSRRAISVGRLKSILRDELNKKRYEIIKAARPALKDIDYEGWLAIDQSKPEAQFLDSDEFDNLTTEQATQYDTISYALTFFDQDEIRTLVDQGEMDPSIVTVGSRILSYDKKGNPITEPLYFIGYANKAIMRLAEVNVVQAVNQVNTSIELTGEGPGYTARYDDGWALRVNPKSTLGFQTKVLLNRIPDVEIINDNGQNVIRRKTSISGFPSYMSYDPVFEQVLQIATTVKPENFESELMDNPLYDNSPVIVGVRLALKDIRAGNEPQYYQMIKQLANLTGLKENGVYILQVTKKKGKSPVVRTFSGAKVKITDQIVANWQGGFTYLLAEKDYVNIDRVFDEQRNTSGVEKYSLNPAVEFTNYEGKKVKGNFAEIYDNEINRIFNEYKSGTLGDLAFKGYQALAYTVKHVLGIELVENDWNGEDQGLVTACVLKALNEKMPGRKDNGLSRFIKGTEVKGFVDLFKRTIGKNLAGEIRIAILNGKYNPDAPFEHSGTALDMLAKIFKEYHKSVKNPQAKNINNDNEHTRVPAEMFSHQVQDLHDPEHLQALSQLPIGKYHPFLQSQFVTNRDTDMREVRMLNYWENMKGDTISGVKVQVEKATDILESRKAGAGDIDLMSMLWFQGTEESNRSDKNPNRGMARYYMPFGDSTAANTLEFPKFSFDFEFTNGILTIKPGFVRDTIYKLFKTEVNRAAAAIEKFNEVNNNPDLTIEQKKAQLDRNYHYREVNGILLPGSATRLYYWDTNRRNLTDDMGLFETMEVDGKMYPTDLQEGVMDDTGELSDEKVHKAFDSFFDKYMTSIVNKKIATFDKFADSLFTTEPVKNDDGTFATPKFQQELFGIAYMESLKKQFGRNSQINGKVISEYFNSKKTSWKTAEEAEANGYHRQLLKAAIIDQQVNHFIALTSFRQLTVDLAAMDEKDSWKSFVDNENKRAKMFASPFNRTASNSQVRYIGIEDVLYGDAKVLRANVQPSFTKVEASLIKFMENHDNLKDYVNEMIPARYKELTAIYYAQVMKKATNERIAHILAGTLKSTITDGGSIVTLKEFLFQELEQGRITSDQYRELFEKYRNPNVKLTVKDRRFLNLKGQKMVAAGSYVEGDRLIPIYMKDSKRVLIPADVKGTKWEPILRDLHALEGNSTVPGPGIQLVPKSALKLSNARFIKLFDENTNVTPHMVDGKVKNTDSGKPMTAIMGAQVSSFPRRIYGEQVQNPDKNKNKTTTSMQLQKNMFLNIPDNTILAVDMFTTPEAAVKVKFERRSSKTREATVSIPAAGITKLELVHNTLGIFREKRERMLQRFIDKYGLDYRISDQWQQAYRDSEYKTPEAWDTRIAEMASSKDSEERERSRYLQYIKFDLTIRTIQKMLHDIKQQAVSKRGVDISQMKALDALITEGEGINQFQQLKMPLTFTPGNRQYQQVIMAEIDKLIFGIKINGTSVIQAAATGHERADESGLKSKVEGDTALKGYQLTYGEDGKVNGFTHAEIHMPWFFRDKAGRLLDYDLYVNEDGTPKAEMFDPEMLKIVGYRIPNTGMNMAGIFNITRFMKPNTSDVAHIPDIIYSQWGADLDFDKMYNYVFHFEKGANGRLQKVKSVINMRQRNAGSVLSGPQAEERAIHNLLMAEDASYRTKQIMFTEAYDRYRSKLNELQGINSNEDDQEDTEASIEFANKKSLEQLSLIRDLIKAEAADLPGASKEVKAFEDQYKSIVDQYNDLQAMITRKKEGFNMDDFLTNGKTPNAFLKVQSEEQLENAYMDVFHILMSDISNLPTMLTPLTSEMITDAVNEKKYQGKSLVDLKESQLAPVNSEAGQTANAAKMRAGDTMIGGLANAAATAHLIQTARISIGLKYPKGLAEIEPMDAIAFTDNEGNVIVEEKEGKAFVTDRTDTDKTVEGYQFSPMRLHLANGTIVNVPHRMYRRRSLNNEIEPIDQLRSALQAFLDLAKDPSAVYTNINVATLNVGVVMSSLGYSEHLFPFLQQQVLQEYALQYTNRRSPFLFDKGNFQDTIIVDLLKKAGIDEEIYWEFREAYQTDDKLPLALRDTLKKVNGNEKFFGVKQLDTMIEQQFDLIPKDSAYYLNQLHVLDMFYRIDTVGKQLFELQQSLDIDSKGIKNGSLLGMRHQKEQIADVANPFSYPLLVGSERLGPYNPRFNKNSTDHTGLISYTYLNKASEFLTSSPERNNVFSDFTKMFEYSRDMLSSTTRRNGLDSLERFNIHIVKYILSNPELYSEFLADIPEKYRGSAHDIRQFVFTDMIVPVNDKGIGRISRSLAASLEQIKDKTDPGSGQPYRVLYPVVNFFKTKVQKGNAVPSWVYNFNTNQFREHMNQQMPFNIVKMLEDPNPDIKRIARFLYLYYYLGSGVTTAHSFGHMLAQEPLFAHNGFADRLNQVNSDLNIKTAALEREVKLFPKTYIRPAWFKVFDKEFIKYNHETSKLMHSLYTQFIQNSPFDAIGKFYEEGTHFEPVVELDNMYRVLDPGKVAGYEGLDNPPSFLDKEMNVYVINRDYNTYTRLNRAGAQMYSEYDFGQPSTPSLLEGNQIRLPELKQNQPDGSVLGDTNQLFSTENQDEIGEHAPFKLDQPTGLQPMFQWAFKEIIITPTDSAEKIEEKRQMQALATALAPLLPANTTVYPYSIAEAKKKFQSPDGQITLLGKLSYGLYRDGNPNGTMELAFEYIDKNKDNPLLMREVVLHESVHSITRNVFQMLRKVKDGTMTKKQLADAMGIKNDITEDVNRTAITKSMTKAWDELNDTFEMLKNNTRLADAYIERTKNDKPADLAREQLKKVIMLNVDEMVSWMFNSKQFRDALNDVQLGTKKKSLLERVIDLIRDVLGLTPGSAAYNAFSNVFDIIDPMRYGTVPISGWTKAGVDNIMPAEGSKAYYTYMAEYIAKVDKMIEDGTVKEFCKA